MKKTTFARKIRLLGAVFVFLGIFFTFTCDNSPFVAGLGPKVDIVPPVIHQILPVSGEFLKENVFRFEARVTDDIGVARVEMWYQYNKTNNKNIGWRMVPMNLKPGTFDWWYADIDSGIAEYKAAKREGRVIVKDSWIDQRPINDNGPFYIYIRAYDGETRMPTESDPNSYKIKLGPPVIALNSPGLPEEFWLTTPNNGVNYLWDDAHPTPVVYVKGDLLGTVNDVQGVKARYPEIKFWDISKGETENSVQWMKFDEYNIEDWGTRVEPAGGGGSEFIRFKLKLMERVNGKPSDTPLPQGDTYRFRIRAYDIGETGTGANQMLSIFPPMEFPAGEICIEASEGPAVVDLFLNRDNNPDPFGSDYLNPPINRVIRDDPRFVGQKDSRYGQKTAANNYISSTRDFVIEARASHSTGIQRADLVVKNLTTGAPEVFLEWAQKFPGDTDRNNDGKVNYLDTSYNTEPASPSKENDPRWVDSRGSLRRQFLFMSPVIKKGVSIFTVDHTGARDGKSFTFEGDEYEISLRVWETAVVDRLNDKDNIDLCSQRGFTVRILDKEPTITVNRVRYAGNVGYVMGEPEYTVNGVFDFNALITDNYGVDESRWWLVKRGYNPSPTAAEWKLPFAPVVDFVNVFAAGNGKTELIPPDTYIDTRGSGTYNSNYLEPYTGKTGAFENTRIPNGEYTLHVMAQGGAEIPATKRVYIKVVQETDLPTVTITNPPNNSVVRELTSLLGSLTDDDGIQKYTIEYNSRIKSDGDADEDNPKWDTPPIITKSLLPANPSDPTASFITYHSLSALNDSIASIETALKGLQPNGGKGQLRVTVYDAYQAKLGADRTTARENSNHPECIVTFTRDIKDPVVIVTKPGYIPPVDAADLAPHIIFSTSSSFKLTGKVIELNLDDFKSPGGTITPSTKLYIRWTVTTTAAGATKTGYIEAKKVSDFSAAKPEYTWELTAADLGFSFDDIENGKRNLTFDAIDRAGNTGTISILFTKDNTAPVVKFIGINENGDYNITTGSGVITDPTSTAALRGTITDLLSDIGFKQKDTLGVEETGNYYFMYRIYSEDTTLTPNKDPAWEKYDLGATTGQSVNWEISLNGASKFWSWPEGIPDGKWYLEIFAADRLNNGAVYGTYTDTTPGHVVNLDTKSDYPKTKVAFYVNRTAPKLAGITPPASIYGGPDIKKLNPGDTVYKLEGSVQDGDLATLAIQLVNSKGQPSSGYTPALADWKSTYKPATNTFNLSWTLLKSDFDKLGDETWTVTITARDAATPPNKEATEKYTFVKDTKAPAVEFLQNISKVQITPEAWNTPGATLDGLLDKVTAVQGSAPALAGTFVDEWSGIGKERVSLPNSMTTNADQYYFEYRIYNKRYMTSGSPAYKDFPEWKKMPLRADTLTTENWSIPLTRKNIEGGDNYTYPISAYFWGGDQIPEGLWWLDIRVLDRIGNTTEDKISGEPKVEHIAFSVDRNDPTLTIVKPGNNTYNTPFTLTGTTMDINFKMLMVEVPTKDGNGKSYEYRKGFNTPGEMQITDRYSGTDEMEKDKDFNWTWTIKSADFTALDDGEYTITITSYDLGGRTKNERYTFIKDTTGPVITPITVTAGGNFKGAANTIIDPTATIRGSFFDTYSRIGYKKDTEDGSGGTKGEYYYEYRIYRETASSSGLAWEKAFIGTDPGQSYNWTIDLTGSASPKRFWGGVLNDIPDGNWYLEIQVYDRTGNKNAPPDPANYSVKFTVDRIAPDLKVKAGTEPEGYYNNDGPYVSSTEVIKLEGTVMDGDFKQLTIELLDSKGISCAGASSPATLTAVAWDSDLYDANTCVYTWTWTLTKTLFDALPEGKNTITLTAVDSGPSNNNTGRKTTLPSYTFIKDTRPPTVEFSNLNPQVIRADVWDSDVTNPARITALNGITKFLTAKPEIKGVINDEYSPIGGTEKHGDKYFYEYRIYTPAQLLDGTYESLPYTKIDLANGSLTTQPLTIPLYGITAGGISYGAGVTIPDGMYWLDIRVMDRINNTREANGKLDGDPADYYGTVKNIAFTVDVTDPTLSVTTAPDSSALSAKNRTHNNAWGTPFTLGGTAVDLNLKGLKIKVDNKDEIIVDYDTANTSGIWGIYTPPQEYAWSWNLENTVTGVKSDGTAGTIPAFKDLDDGSHTITITAYDYAGRISTPSIPTNSIYTFVKDTTPPTVTFGNIKKSTVPTDVTVISDTAAELRGSFNDLNSYLGYLKDGDSLPYYFEYRIYSHDNKIPSAASSTWKKPNLTTTDRTSSDWSIALDLTDAFWNNLDGIPDGIWWLEIKVADRVGNDKINLDYTKPSHPKFDSEVGDDVVRTAFYVNRKDPAFFKKSDNTSGIDKIEHAQVKSNVDGDKIIFGPQTVDPFYLEGKVFDGDFKVLTVELVNSEKTRYADTFNASTWTTGYTDDFTYDAAKCEYSWKWILTLDYFTNKLTEGTNTLTVTAVDSGPSNNNNGRKTSVSYTIDKDTKPPVVSFNNNFIPVDIDSATWIAGTAANPTNEAKKALDDKIAQIMVLTESPAVISGTFTDFSRIGYKRDPENSSGQYYYQYRVYNAESLKGTRPTPTTVKFGTPGSDTQTSESWSISLPAANYQDGMWWLDIIVADRVGNTNEHNGATSPGSIVEHIAFTIDRNPPVLKDLKVNGDDIDGNPAPSNIFKNAFILTGKVREMNLRGLKILVEGNDLTKEKDYRLEGNSAGIWGTKAPLVDDAGVKIDEYPWTWNIDTHFDNFFSDTSTPDGQYTVTVTAYDFAGRVGTKRYTFIKDKTPPEVTLNNLEGDGSTIIEETNAVIRVSLNDLYSKIGNDNTAPGLGSNYYFKYRIYRNGASKDDADIPSPDEGSVPYSKALLGGAPNTSMRHNIYLTDEGYSANSYQSSAHPHTFWDSLGEIPDGVWWIEIEAVDRVGNDTKLITTDSTTTPPTTKTRVKFIVDRKPPTLTAGIVNHGVNVSQDGKPEDNKFIYKPQTDITGIAPNDKVFTLSGTVMDGDLDKLTITMKYQGGAIVAGTPFVLTPADAPAKWSFNTSTWEYNWSWSLPLTTFNDTSAENAFKDGTYTITIAATDVQKRANTNTRETTYTIVKDCDPPEVEFTNIKPVVIDAAGWGSSTLNDTLKTISTIEGSNLVIRGTFNDIVSRIGAHAQVPKVPAGESEARYYYEYRIYTSDKLTPDTRPGYAKLYFSGDDTLTTENWSINLGGASPGETLAGTAANFWTQGTEEVEDPPDSGTYIQRPVNGIPDGVYLLDIRVLDRVGNTNEHNNLTVTPKNIVENIAFTVDRAAPTLRITGTNNPNTNPKNTFKEAPKLTGIASDANLWGVTIQVENNGVVYGTKDFKYPDDAAFWKTITAPRYNWEWDTAEYFNNGDFAEGSHTITVTAYDHANKFSTSRTYTFVKDTVAPVITLNNLELDGSVPIQDSNAVIRLSFNDDNSRIGLYNTGTNKIDNHFKYRVYRAVGAGGNDPAPGSLNFKEQKFETAAGAEILDPGKSASYNIPLTGSNANFWPTTDAIPDGVYWLEIQVFDRVGKEQNLIGDDPADANRRSRVKFTVDRNAPKMVQNSGTHNDPMVNYAPGIDKMDKPVDNFFNGDYANGNITLSGKIRDGDLDTLTIAVTNDNYPDEDNPKILATLHANVPSEWVSFAQGGWVTDIPADLIYAWSWSLDKATFGANATIAEGDNTIIVTATDKGNPARTTKDTYKFIKDTAAPLVKYHNIEPVVIDKALWDAGGDALSDARGSMSSFGGAGSEIKGAFEDGNSLIGYWKDEVEFLGPGETNPNPTFGKYYFKYRIYEKEVLTGNTWSEESPSWEKIYFDTAPTNRSANWTITLPAKTDGTYLLDIRIADRSNNSETENIINSDPTKSNIVNHVAFAMDIKAPELDIKRVNSELIPAPPAPAPSNIFKEPFTLSGQASDGNFHRLTVKVDDNKEEVFTYNGTVYNWSWTIKTNRVPVYKEDGITIDGYIAGFNDLDDGTHTVTIIAYDTAGKSTSKTYSFIKDATGPVITLNNLNLSGSSITDLNAQIRVSFNDEHSNIGKTQLTEGDAKNYYFEYVIYHAGSTSAEIASVKTNWEKGRLGAVTGRSANYTILLTGNTTGVANRFWNNLNAIPDGDWVLEIKVDDRLGTLTEEISDNNIPVVTTAAAVTFNVNRGGPVITVTTKPLEKYGGANPDTISMAGKVMDGDFDSLTIKVTSGPANNPTTSVTAINPAVTPIPNSGGDHTWTWTLDNTTFKSDNVAQGTNTITITAADTAGNTTTETFDFVKDTVKPSAQFLNIKEVTINRTEWTNGDAKKNQIGSIEELTDPKIRGLFVDITSSIADEFKYRIYGYDLLSDADAPLLPSASWSTGTLEAGDLRTKNWTIDLGDDRPDGTYWLDIDVKDIFGNAYHNEKIAFALDRDPPKLELGELDPPNENNVFKDPFSMSIKAEDGNLDYVKIVLNGTTEIDRKPANGSTVINWTFSLPFIPDVNRPHSIIVTAYDLSGKTAFGQINFTTDTQGPSVSLSGSLAEPITALNAAITGSFSDDYSRIGKDPGTFTGIQMYFFEYYIAKTTGTVPDGAWKPIPLSSNTSLSTNWTIPLTNVSGGIWPFASPTMDDLPDGSYYLYIRVYDRLGNETVTPDYAFSVDRKAPEFIYQTNYTAGIEANIPNGSSLTNPAYSTALTLKGRVRDGNLNPGTLAMTISGGGKTNEAVSIDYSSSNWDQNGTGELPWSWTMDKDYFTDLPDAKYTIVITAQDTSTTPKTGTATYTFTKDVHPPRVEFSNVNKIDISSAVWIDGNAPNAGDTAKELLQSKLDGMTVIQGNNPVINGTFEDDVSQIGAVKYSFSGGSMYYFEYRIYGAKELTSNATMPGWTKQSLATETQTNQPWTIPLSGAGSLFSSGIPDGMYWLDIKVSDRECREESDRATHEITVSNIAFTVDRKAPELSIRSPDPEADKNTVFGTALTLKGKIKDGNLRGIRIKVDESAEEVYAIPQPTPAPAGITVSAPGADDIANTNPQFIDGSDVYTWTWTIPTTARVDSGPVWNSTLPDGPHTVTVTAYDFAGRTTPRQYTFIKDTTAPEITVSSLEGADPSIEDTDAKIRLSIYDAYSTIGNAIDNTGNSGTNPAYGQYYFEYRIYPSTKVTGDNDPIWVTYGLTSTPGQSAAPSISLTRTKSGDNTPNADYRDTYWSGLNEIPDGLWKLDIRVKDKIGNTNSTTVVGRQFRVNRKAPVINVTPLLNSLPASWIGDDIKNLGGSANVINLTSIEVVDGDLKTLTIQAGGTTTTLNNGAYTMSNNTWKGDTWSINKTNFEQLPEGKNTITITAKDDGNRETSAVYTFTKDTNAPKITINGINQTQIYSWDNNTDRSKISTITGDKATIRGSFDDEVSRVGLEETEPATIENDQGQTVPNPNLGKYYYEYRIYEADRLGNKPPMRRGYFITADPNTTVNWDVPLFDVYVSGTLKSGNIPDGYYWLDITVADRTGNINTLNNVAFAVDRGPPSVYMDSSTPHNSIIKGTFTLEGHVVDFTYAGLIIKVDGGDPETNIGGSWNASNYTQTWTWAPSDFDALVDGQHTITITAYDSLQNSTSYPQITFIKDTQPPTIEYNNLGEGSERIEDVNAALRGSIRDDTSSIGYTIDGVSPTKYSFKYRIRRAGASSTPTDPGWTRYPLSDTVGKSVNWDIALNGTSSIYWDGTAGIPDGTWYLDIIVADRTGNDTTESAPFTVDRNPPELTVTGFTDNAIYGAQSGTVFTLNITARDVNLADLKIQVDGGSPVFSHTWNQIDGTQSGESTNSIDSMRQYTTTWLLTLGDFNNLGDERQHTVTVTASDIARRTNIQSFTFIKDTVKPTVEFQSLDTNPLTPTTFEVKAFKILGIAEDAVGVYSIETKIEKYNRGEIPPWTVVTDTTGAQDGDYTMLMLAGSTGTLGTTRNWTKQIIGSGDEGAGLQLADGLYRITVRVRDRATPVNVSLNGQKQPNGTVINTAEVEFRVDTKMPSLVINPTPAFVNGSNHLSTHPFSSDYANQGPSSGYPALPAVRGFYLTGTTDSTFVGMSRVSATLSDGSTEKGPYIYTIPAGHEYDTGIKWGILIPYADLEETDYTVNVDAISTGGKYSSRSRAFTFDITLPSSSIITPPLKQEISGSNYVVKGASSDNNAVSKVEYWIGKNTTGWTDANLAPNQIQTILTGGLYNWNFALNVLDTGSGYANAANAYQIQMVNGVISASTSSNLWLLPFRIRITDVAGNQYENDTAAGDKPSVLTNPYYFLILDPDKDIPTAIIGSPEPNEMKGGEVLITGQANDDNWVYAVMVRVLKDGITPVVSAATNNQGWALATIANPGTSVMWSYSINKNGELNSTTGEFQDVTIEVRPIDSKLLETLAKEDFSPKDFSFDNFTDPINKNRVGPMVNRAFRISNALPTIKNTQIKRPNDTAAVPYELGLRTAGTFVITADVASPTELKGVQWRSLTYASLWKDMLSNYGTLTPGNNLIGDGATYKIDMPASITVSSTSLTKGRKYMIKDAGDVNWTSIGADNNSPYTVFVYNGTAVSGSGGSVYVAQDGTALPGPNYSASLAWEQKFYYPLTITINSAVRYPVNGSAGSPASGSLVVDIKADDRLYSSTLSLNLQIDNYYPTGAYNAPRNASTSTYWVQGTAVDIGTNSGPIGGVKEVLAYFSRGTTYYNPYGMPWGTAGTTSMNNVMDGASPLKDMTNITSYPNMAAQLNTTGQLPDGKILPPDVTLTNLKLYPAARIKQNEVSTDNDGNGYVELFSDKGGTITWGFRFETRNFIDGPITLHYIVIDEAGNNTHYTQSLYIRNKPPIIKSITLKTDLNYSHQYETKTQPPYDQPLDATKIMAPESKAGYKTTNFNAKNYRLRFEIETMTGSGNGLKTFRVTPVTPAQMPVSPTSNLTPGEVYTIVVPGNIDWVLAGASTNFNAAGITFVCTDAAVRLQDSPDVMWGVVDRYTVIKNKDAVKEPTEGTSMAINFGDRFNWNTGGTDGDFRQAAGYIQDSSLANGGNNGLFLVKVFDSTVTTGSAQDIAESNQQADVVLVGLNVMNVDTTAPTALINPFHWTSVSDNSLYQNSRSNGHIELEASTGSRPKVSGQISIRGTVSDNNIIGSLWVQMSTFTFANAPNDTAVTNYARIANYDSTNGLVGVGNMNDGWKCTISNPVIDQNGHRVDWQLDIDTSKITNVANTNRVFTIRARDMTANIQAEETTNNTTGTTKTARYTMDVVPYILSVTTRLSSAYSTVPSAFNRSAQGWYPVREDEVITIQGFNLYGGSGNPSVDIRQASDATAVGAALYTTPGGTSGISTGSHSARTIYARVDNNGADNGTGNNSNNTITSGYLVVRVNNVDSINNTNNNTAGDKTIDGVLIPGYNREGNGLNNDTLTDDRALYVWNMGEISAFRSPTYVYQPFMRMDRNGNRLLSYGFYSITSNSGRLKVQKNNDEYNAGGSYSNRMLNTTIAVANTNAVNIGNNTATPGNPSWYAAGSDISSGATQNRGFQLDLSSTSGTSNNSDRTTGNGAGDDNSQNYTNSVALTNVSGANMDRYKIPRIAVLPTNATGTNVRSNGNADRILLSFYDDETANDIRIIYANVGGGIAQANVGNLPNPATGNVGNANAPANSEVVTNDSQTHPGSIYTAAGFLSNGLPVLAWYDRVNQNLVLSWGNLTTNLATGIGNDARVSTTTAQWQANAAIITKDSKLHTSFGTHVDMAVDAGDNIHLAFYQVNPVGLWYALIPSTGTGAGRRPNITKSGNIATNVTPIRVDTYLSAGTKLMINVRRENGRDVPYITYHQASFPGSNNTIRVAWRTDFSSLTDNTDDQNKFKGTWEVMTVPVGSDVTPSVDEFVCNGVPTGTGDWVPPTGSTLRSYATLNKSILVGYMTDKWYEGAILKRDLW